MPSLENLRKQAKLYVRWHRDGYYPVAAHIRAVLPRYRSLSDREVLQAQFKLNDAQELVARQNGFQDWRALKEGVSAVTGGGADAGDVQATPDVMVVEAQIYVTDLDASCDFYRSTLGFEVAFVYGEPAFYAQVRRGDARLNLRRVDEPVFVGDIREREQLLSASITLTSAAVLRELFVDYRDLGGDLYRTLTAEPWGARTFIVRDPDGNLILFAAAAS
ncbi:VOC family protein [Mycolicibacterium septicum]|uniref:VOC family protein n=1 Tax=Mycolicibacterium septicum TaxID=98668 RepID=UPI0023E0A216|nr:VOC family protein [Mycolicibacterium septicum]MDF3335871.1 VOC family protein [Mycolicibacterium septicum]